ncbi:MAG: dihydroxyacetone kinase phosphoryl donor subunit DhaM [Bilifractor sp.]|jgi:PTS hybrid protein
MRMVGIVIVSHIRKLAEGVIELTRMMAESVPAAPAGGLEDGSPGTSYHLIRKAIDSVYSEDGVIVLVDMGSAAMTTKMVIEMEETDRNVVMADCPLVEGAVTASVDAEMNLSLPEILEDLNKVASTPKF